MAGTSINRLYIAARSYLGCKRIYTTFTRRPRHYMYTFAYRILPVKENTHLSVFFILQPCSVLIYTRSLSYTLSKFCANRTATESDLEVKIWQVAQQLDRHSPWKNGRSLSLLFGVIILLSSLLYPCIAAMEMSVRYYLYCSCCQHVWIQFITCILFTFTYGMNYEHFLIVPLSSASFFILCILKGKGKVPPGFLWVEPVMNSCDQMFRAP